jgi:hypothetical protein
MDSMIAAAARALTGGDALGALKLVALRDDAPALALRGIAMAQLGDYALAASLRKPKWRWPCATSAARREHWPKPQQRSKHAPIARTRSRRV